MKKVIFPIVKEIGSNKIVYPDLPVLFSNAEVLGTNIIADYSGAIPLTEYVAPTLPQTDFILTNPYGAVDIPYDVTFTTELADGDYFVRFRVAGSSRLET